MSGGNLGNFGGLMIKYAPDYVEWFREADSFITNLPKKEKWEGEKGVQKNHVRMNVGVGNQSDGGALPVAGYSQYVETEWTRKFTTASARITDGLLATAATSSHAARGALDDIMKSTLDMIARYENFMAYRDGTGEVSLLGEALTATKLVKLVDGRLAGIRGARLELRDTAGTTIEANFTASSMPRGLTAGLAQLTVEETQTNAVGTADSSRVIWGQGAHSSYGKAITGLEAGIDDAVGVFQGLDTTSYPEMTSPVLSASADRNLSTRLVRQMLALLAQESGKGQVEDLVVCSSIYQAVNWEELFMAEQRTSPTTRIGGVKVPTFQSMFGQVSLRTDADMYHDKIFFVDRKHIKMPIQKELDWRRTGSSIFIPDPNNTLSWIANMVGIYDLYYDKRNAHGKIENLAVTKLGAY